MKNRLLLNVVSNYVGQIYIAIIGIIVVPIYLAMLGNAGFGLVSFFTLLQTILIVLDLGISATLSREVATLKSRPGYFSIFSKIFKIVIVFFGILSLLIVFGFNSITDFITTKWLNIDGLNANSVNYSLSVMGGVVSLRWCGGPLKSIILGCEKQILYNVINVIAATLRFAIVIPVMSYFGKDIRVFFTYQLFAAIAEFLMFLLAFLYCYKGLKVSNNKKEKENKKKYYNFFEETRRVGHFSFGIALSSVVWIAISQSDKIILSKYLSISDYGAFSAAVTIASGILILSTPVSQALLPRMSSLFTSGDTDELYKIYSLSTKIIISILVPISLVMAFNAKKVMFIWTGNNSLALMSYDILIYYVLGNLFFAIAAFPYYLQYAYGNLKLHLYGNMAFLIIIIPSLIIGIKIFGVKGAGIVWLVQNLIFMMLWSWIVHSHFIKNKRVSWILKNVIFTFIPTLVIAILSKLVLPEQPDNRLTAFIGLTAEVTIAFILTILSDDRCKTLLLKIIKNIIKR